MAMTNKDNFPPGWDEQRVRKVLAHYGSQTEEQAVAEDGAAEQPPNPYRPQHAQQPAADPDGAEATDAAARPSRIGKHDRLQIDLMAARGESLPRIRRYLQMRGYEPANVEAALEDLGFDPRKSGAGPDVAVRVVGALLVLIGLALGVVLFAFGVAAALALVVSGVGLVLLVGGRDAVGSVGRAFDRFIER